MSVPIEDFFQGYASALLSFSPEAIASYYQTPPAIYSGQGIRFVEEPSETLSFWTGGVKPYAAMGIQKTTPPY